MIEIGTPCEASNEFALDAALDAIAAAMLWPKNDEQRDSFVLDRHLRRILNIPLDNTNTETKLISKGLIAGYILRNAIAKLRLRETFKLSDFKSAFSEKELFNYSKKTIDNEVWPTFRGVSPLWASYIVLVEAGVVEKSRFPCLNNTLPELLAIAECFKKEGQIRTLRSREQTLLRKCEGYILSETIVDALPPFAAEAYSLDFVKT